MLINIEGIQAFCQTIRNPRRIIPHATFPTFSQIPCNINYFLEQKFQVPVDIRALVLDKDNCITLPNETTIAEAELKKIREFQNIYGEKNVILLSNSIGTRKLDPTGELAAHFQQKWNIPVVRHSKLKPLCTEELYTYLSNNSHVSSASQILFIGDRLLTDITLANIMGSWGVWLTRGVGNTTNMMMEVESWLYKRIHTQNPYIPTNRKS
ncbi:phosphatidylglycerol phosphate phosphatase Gep4 [Schizosaccharomyces pombe]|uniref:Probable phosphatidylglycerophosphatase, mitochondrial n=1 Tax=Schizosaccharomyces pombe (strain 972 / ATCC 24843) TaxID=284812 RepID=GEP4_SCHPO|nr:putative cardiolipin synthase PGP phosphatase domain-containing Gep4 [Schizosaccharomyces pombe]Q9Y7U3.2 RecName: Full=Probable phosphatidylglycerophosphatase, mitochondrial; AltName: Full=PGP phosphatase [Schizosaccharomyces pombe 972h-]CAB39898.2 mitochondrial matrix PGP phosphatase involved in cardiolipin biosynthesis Gep4 (predicted) [Schizosaccharomyces pombe]|eukprot:NP_588111.2 putative cardiolipin synthase PGP phosphatase domain-containing Gep4 [Schizosaccharomyces pombe]